MGVRGVAVVQVKFVRLWVWVREKWVKIKWL